MSTLTADVQVVAAGDHVLLYMPEDAAKDRMVARLTASEAMSLAAQLTDAAANLGAEAFVVWRAARDAMAEQEARR